MTATPRHTATTLIDCRQRSAEDNAALLQLVYDELRRLARAMLNDERAGHTLQPTALVHEAWMRLIDASALAECDVLGARRRFLVLGARAMRQVLVDHARRRGAQKRGGDLRRITFADIAAEADDTDLLDVELALSRLEKAQPRPGKVAELRIFGGLTLVEIAETLEISRTTVDGDWALARAMLTATLREGETEQEGG